MPPTPSEQEWITLRPEGRPWIGYLNPLRPVATLWRHRGLVGPLVKADLASRYRGAFFGIAWMILLPLLFMAVYTFVFHIVLRARWQPSGDDGPAAFALALFGGLVLYSLFSDTATAAPTLMAQHRSFVHKTLFPLELLVLISVGSALVRVAAGFAVLLLGVVVITGELHWTWLLLPLTVVPVLLISVGAGWFLAAVGVAVKDTPYLVAIGVQILFFMTPIVYPISSVPERVRFLVAANPLTAPVEAVRACALWGRPPDWTALAIATAVALAICQVGYLVFMKSRRTVADRL